MNKSWWLFAYLWLFFLNSTVAQDTLIGDHLYKNKSYSEAILEYERFLYQDNRSLEETMYVYMQIAACYREKNCPEKNLSTLDKIDPDFLSDSSKISFHTEIAVANLLYGNYAKTILHTNMLRPLMRDSVAWMSVFPLILLANAYSNDKNSLAANWVIFKRLAITSQTLDIAAEKVINHKNKKYRGVIVMNALIPGIGLLALGKIKKGIAGNVLVLSSIYYTVSSYSGGLPITASTSGIGLSLKTYLGNMNLCKKALEDKRNRKKTALLDNFKEELLTQINKDEND